ncbi:MAG: phosphoribosylformylglycinamidine synthase subunit PurS [Acidimicrobiia bacterium]
MRVRVLVKRRADISDPHGQTVANALHDLGYEDVRDVRIDKLITVVLPESDPSSARARVAEMCEKLLANPVIEDFEVEIES